MDIGHLCKRDKSDHDCAVVALQMALEYYHKGIDEGRHIDPWTYKETRAFRARREGHWDYYALPWGVCLAAAEAGLKAIFISNNTGELTPESVTWVAGFMTNNRVTEEVREGVRAEAEEQVGDCRNNRNIELYCWREEYERLAEETVRQELGVVIPTIKIPGGAHSVVVTECTPDDWIRYNDPNSGKEKKGKEQFKELWRAVETDNDLIVLSPKRIDIEDILG